MTTGTITGTTIGTTIGMITMRNTATIQGIIQGIVVAIGGPATASIILTGIIILMATITIKATAITIAGVHTEGTPPGEWCTAVPGSCIESVARGGRSPTAAEARALSKGIQ